MTKKEKIQRELGDLSINADENGWLKKGRYIPIDLGLQCSETEVNTELGIWRPNTLSGIENNNGWIKIESEDDIKNITDDLDYLCGLMDKNGIFNQHKGIKSGNFIRHESRLGYVNRYQPIQKIHHQSTNP